MIDSQPPPAVTADQMREVDRAMVDDFGIDLISMMENAGRNLAWLARDRFLDGDAIGKYVTVLAGRGGNGGGALVCARHLHNWGCDVTVTVTVPAERFAPVPARQLAILNAMGLPVVAVPPAEPSSLVIDGIIGYSLSRAPRGTSAELVRWANDQSAPVLSLDLPTGLDPTTGEAFDPTVRAAATLTLALPKTGLYVDSALEFAGELYLADIGVPPALYARLPLGLEVGRVFARSEIVRLKPPFRPDGSNRT